MTTDLELPPLPPPTWTPTNRTAGFAWSEDDMHAYVAPAQAALDRALELAASHSDECEKWAAMHQRDKAALEQARAEVARLTEEAKEIRSRWNDAEEEMRVEVERLTRERDQLADARNAAIERSNFMHTMTREAQEIASAANEHAAATLREVGALREALRLARPHVEAHRDYCLGKHGVVGKMDMTLAAIDAAIKSPTPGKEKT